MQDIFTTLRQLHQEQRLCKINISEIALHNNEMIRIIVNDEVYDLSEFIFRIPVEMQFLPLMLEWTQQKNIKQ